MPAKQQKVSKKRNAVSPPPSSVKRGRPTARAGTSGTPTGGRLDKAASGTSVVSGREQPQRGRTMEKKSAKQAGGPPAGVMTRAGAAAASKGGGGAGAGSGPAGGDDGKRRKVEEGPVPDAPSPACGGEPAAEPPTPPAHAPVAADDKNDDTEGHYVPKENDVLDETWTVARRLGAGTYGTVVKAVHKTTNEIRAVKLFRDDPAYRRASKKEIEILKLLSDRDPENHHHCVRLKKTFHHKGHVCLVFPMLGPSLSDWMRENSSEPFPIDQVRTIGSQMLSAMEYVHRKGIIHADLKPENVLLENTSCMLVGGSGGGSARRVLLDPDARIIDFGCGVVAGDEHETGIQTEPYRAPEVVADLRWSYPVDIFSIGLIILEMFLGGRMFRVRDRLQHLAAMEVALGVMPANFRSDVKATHPDWFRGDALRFPVADTPVEQVEINKRIRPIEEFFDSSKVEEGSLLHLVKALLRYDPKARLTAAQGLNHVFFTTGSASP